MKTLRVIAVAIAVVVLVTVCAQILGNTGAR